ncbi:hypothetical protein RLOatenuis_6820 [Rickettsiales bacterium]|nr:hypothetical protein RLOatenuis_6820 [Rickettsiales bacterium]
MARIDREEYRNKSAEKIYSYYVKEFLQNGVTLDDPEWTYLIQTDREFAMDTLDNVDRKLLNLQEGTQEEADLLFKKELAAAWRQLEEEKGVSREEVLGPNLNREKENIEYFTAGRGPGQNTFVAEDGKTMSVADVSAAEERYDGGELPPIPGTDSGYNSGIEDEEGIFEEISLDEENTVVQPDPTPEPSKPAKGILGFLKDAWKAFKNALSSIFSGGEKDMQAPQYTPSTQNSDPNQGLDNTLQRENAQRAETALNEQENKEGLYAKVDKTKKTKRPAGPESTYVDLDQNAFTAKKTLKKEAQEETVYTTIAHQTTNTSRDDGKAKKAHDGIDNPVYENLINIQGSLEGKQIEEAADALANGGAEMPERTDRQAPDAPPLPPKPASSRQQGGPAAAR